MIDFTEQILDNRRALINDLLRRLEKWLEPFADDLQGFLSTLLKSRLPPDWRDQWHAFVDESAAKGFVVKPESIVELEAWIEAWARRRRLLPEAVVPDDLQPKLESPPEIGGQWFAMAGPVDEYALAGSVTTGLLAAVPVGGGTPSRRLPRSAGKWIKGTEGEGVWKLHKPIVLEDGTKITQVTYRKGMPVFDEWSKGEVHIAIVGDNKFDRPQAIRKWHADGGGEISRKYVFHHDGLTTKSIQYKGNEVLIGRMQLVPKELNDMLPHIGSASKARQQQLARKIANEVNELALHGKGPLARMATRFKSRFAKAGKKLGRLLPVVGGTLLILDFKENAEAHGLGGALIRSAPLLGDLVTVYDVANDLAEQIKSDADKQYWADLEKINRVPRQARAEAAELTVKTFKDIAQRLHVTNQYFEAESLEQPLQEFFETVLPLFLLRLENRPIKHPEGMTIDDETTESAFDARLRRARDKLERGIREKVEEPKADATRGTST